MKKSVLQQLNLMKYSGTQSYTASFARRVLLLVSFLLLSLGSVWGQEYVRYELTDIGYAGGSNGREHRTISQSEYKKYGEDVTVEVTFVANKDLGAGESVGGLSDGGFSKTEGSIAPSVSVRSGEQFSVQYSISFLDGILENSNDKRIVFNVYNKLPNSATGQASFEKAEVLVPVPKPDDPFLNTAKTPLLGEGSDSEEKQQYTDVFGELSFAKIQEAFSGMEGVKYARIYVTKDGNNVEYNKQVDGKNLLTVTGGRKAGSAERNGLYVYNNGQNLNLGNINVTLNAGIGNLDKYKIVVLLSESLAVTVDGNGNVTKEPQWDYEYTYSFTYPFITKIRYKTLIVSGNGSSYTAKPMLLANWFELAGDCGVDKQGLVNNLCVRWYLADKQGVELARDYSITASRNQYNGNTNNKGFYKNRGWTAGQFHASGQDNDYRVDFTINIPSGMTYSNVRLVCEATTLGGNFGDDTKPDKIQVKYIYDLKKSDELKFAHYEGEAYRHLLMEVGDVSKEAKKEDFDYIQGADEGVAAETWDSEKNDYKNDLKNVRQNVHTVHYYYYVDKARYNEKLILPLQYYDYTPAQGGGAEPRAYFRWYDYNSDKKSKYLSPAQNNNNNYLNRNNSEWGHFAYNFDTGQHPTHNRVGVTFNANLAFNTDKKEEVVIACDVSRYLDGMDESFQYLVHEPTLSIRYLFHIKPAEAIADEIYEKISANNTGQGLLAIEKKIRERTLGESVSILENEGRTVVSTNGGFGEFALRTKLSSLDYYYFYAGAGKTGLTQAKSLWWYAYYYDENSKIWWRHLVPRKTYRDRDGRTLDQRWTTIRYRTQTYQAKYSLAPMNWPASGGNDEYSQGDFEGNWERWDGNGWQEDSNEPKTDGIGVGDRVQMVACVSSSDGSSTPGTNIMPIIWTELEFLDAKPLELNKKSDNNDNNMEVDARERTDVYMGKEYVLAKQLEFNDFSLFGMRKPTDSYENFASIPMQYRNAQYSFIYPQLYGYCATMRGITWNDDKGHFGQAAMHGDYALLKSMNMEGISMDKDFDGYNGQSIQVDWVNGNTLFDVTYERKYGTDITDNDDYGSFIYVDAADEARTIATLEFDASLCANAKIYYTAYVASMTGRTIALDINGNGEPGYVDASDTRTTPQAAPMLRFRVSVEKEPGVYVPVTTFVTGNIRQEVQESGTENNANNKFSEATWYQVYGYTTIPSDLAHLITNEVERHYRVEIDNYCDNTDGADYCVDQISFYTNNAQLRVKQTPKITCGEDGVSLNIFMEEEQMEKLDIIDSDVYWRIYIDESKKNENGESVDKNGNTLSFDGIEYKEDSNGKYLIGKDFYGTNLDEYGKVNIPKYDGSVDNEGDLGLKGGYFTITENNRTVICYSFISKNFVMQEGPDYYISIYTGVNPNDPKDGEYWGNPSTICSAYSPVFVPKVMFLSVSDIDGNVNPTIEVACSDHVAHLADYTMILNVPDDTKETGYVQKKIPFDYFIGNQQSLNEFTITLDGVVYHLEDALEHYRAKGKTDTEKAYIKESLWDYDEAGLSSRYKGVCEKNEDVDDIKGYYAVLEKARDEGKLYLAHSSEFSLPIDVNHSTILAFATIDEIRNSKDIPEETFQVCSPMPLFFNVQDNLQDPSMMLGFKDVTYKKNLRVVRVGKEQLDKMQKDGYLLHIPVNEFKADTKKDNDANSALEITTGKLELLAYEEDLVGKEDAKNGVEKWTNDAEVKDNMYVAEFTQTTISGDYPYISLQFKVDETSKNPNAEDGLAVTKWDFKEGFTYRMFFQVKNGHVAPEEKDKACSAGVEFLLKVVPKYVTWNDGSVTGANRNVNTNWNNDKNWSRSKKDELHKTAEHNTDGYKDNGTKSDETGASTTPAAFVPMKFTYVTIPSNNKAPQLVNLEYKDKVGIIDSTLINYTKEELATDSIEYDLMVRYTEEECIDHGITGNVYDCEKFYGNWAKEIYFKPEAELVNQHYLTYEKVWVEKKLTAGTWTLMSTPLQNTYAGDMYVPFADGRQTTEAFQPIYFNDKVKVGEENVSLYSRTKYPIYQRSWAQKDSKVYTKTNDVRKTDYSANLVGSVGESLALWSHTYNDVKVPYSTWMGFAIRAHKSDYSGTRNDKALLRLPKEDESYDYYQWDNTLPADDDGKVVQTVNKRDNDDKVATGKLFTDGEAKNGVTYGVDYQPTDNNNKKERTAGDGTIEMDIENLQGVKDANDNYYLLVGNPYLCSIDMAAFFANENNKSILEEGYWTYEHNTINTPYKQGSIKPLQSFFVKAKSNEGKIVFNDEMMIDGNTKPVTQSAPAMRMTAANDRGQSTATVSVGNEAKTVETLFDSNLDDVPMVYTVANGQAMSINQLTALDKPIAFGVTCAASDEPVAVTFSDIEQLTSGEVYVVDAVTNERTAVGEGSVLTIQPNDYGRYFLLAGATDISGQATVTNGIVVSVRGRAVTVTSNEALTQVRALALDGTTVYQDTTAGTSASFTLAPGVYIIKAENAAGEQQTVKIVIRTV